MQNHKLHKRSVMTANAFLLSIFLLFTNTIHAEDTLEERLKEISQGAQAFIDKNFTTPSEKEAALKQVKKILDDESLSNPEKFEKLHYLGEKRQKTIDTARQKIEDKKRRNFTEALQAKNDEVHEIYFERKKGALKSTELEAFLIKIAASEWDHNTSHKPYFLTNIAEATRAMAYLGNAKAAAIRLNHYFKKFKFLDSVIRQESEILKDSKLTQSSPLAVFYYSKAIIAMVQAKQLAKKKDMEGARKALVSMDKNQNGLYSSATVNFMLLAKKYPQSRYTKKALVDYDLMRKYYLAYGGKRRPKDLPLAQSYMSFGNRPLPMSTEEMLKSLEDLDARLNATKTDPEKANLLYLAIHGYLQLKKYDKAEHLYQTLVSKYALISNPKAPLHERKIYAALAEQYIHAYFETHVKRMDRELKIKNNPEKRKNLAPLIKLRDQAAFRIHLREASAGDAQAQLLLGEAYSKGKGILENFIEAKRWLQKSADQGNTKAAEALKTLR